MASVPATSSGERSSWRLESWELRLLISASPDASGVPGRAWIRSRLMTG